MADLEQQVLLQQIYHDAVLLRNKISQIEWDDDIKHSLLVKVIDIAETLFEMLPPLYFIEPIKKRKE